MEAVLSSSCSAAGGRCRALPDGTDNGTHALLGANTAALGLLRRIGALDGWVEPEPAGLPVLDLRDGRAFRVALSPWGWTNPALRPPGFSAGALLALCDTLPALKGDEADAVRRLVEQGPPAEEVGLEGYGAPLISSATIPVGAPR